MSRTINLPKPDSATSEMSFNDCNGAVNASPTRSLNGGQSSENTIGSSENVTDREPRLPAHDVDQTATQSTTVVGTKSNAIDSTPTQPTNECRLPPTVTTPSSSNATDGRCVPTSTYLVTVNNSVGRSDANDGCRLPTTTVDDNTKTESRPAVDSGPSVLGNYIGLPDGRQREYNIPPGINPLMPSGYNTSDLDNTATGPVLSSSMKGKSSGNSGMIIGLILGIIALIAIVYWFRDSFKH